MHPILFKFHFITIYTYGFMVAVAFLICARLLSARFKETGLDENLAFDLAVYILIFGIIGARLLHVLLNAGYYFGDVKEIFMLQRGGLAIQGGFISAFLAAIVFIKKHRLDAAKICDIIIPYAALGESIGRLGCYFNGCCYGRPTDFWTAVTFPCVAERVHPTQLYSAFFLLMIFVILKIKEKKKNFDWQIVSLYLILYPVMRASIDFLRGDLEPIFLGLTTSQLISIGLFLSGLILYFVKSRRHKP